MKVTLHNESQPSLDIEVDEENELIIVHDPRHDVSGEATISFDEWKAFQGIVQALIPDTD